MWQEDKNNMKVRMLAFSAALFVVSSAASAAVCDYTPSHLMGANASTAAGVTTGAIAATAGEIFIKGAKFMPAGLVATLGAAGFAYNFKKFLEWEDAENGAIE